MANIAEGFGRGTQAEFVLFLGYAIGSLNETQSHLVVAFDRQYVAKAEYGKLFEDGTQLRKSIIKFIGSMVKRGSGVKHIRKQITWTDRILRDYEKATGQPHPALLQAKANLSADEQ